jgi:hypothetical protein
MVAWLFQVVYAGFPTVAVESHVPPRSGPGGLAEAMLADDSVSATAINPARINEH